MLRINGRFLIIRQSVVLILGSYVNACFATSFTSEIHRTNSFSPLERLLIILSIIFFICAILYFIKRQVYSHLSYGQQQIINNESYLSRLNYCLLAFASPILFYFFLISGQLHWLTRPSVASGTFYSLLMLFCILLMTLLQKYREINIKYALIRAIFYVIVTSLMLIAAFITSIVGLYLQTSSGNPL